MTITYAVLPLEGSSATSRLAQQTISVSQADEGSAACGNGETRGHNGGQ